MRTTLTIDDDVAIQLERLRKEQGKSLKDAVNEVLRVGFVQLATPPQNRVPFCTKAVNNGEILIGNIDNIAEVLAIAEGDDYK